MPTLDAHKQLLSDLWIDQPDAHEGVGRRLSAGRISESEAQQLHHFIDEGYLKTALDLDDEFGAAFRRDVERMWSERPADLAVAAQAGDLRSFRDAEDSALEVGYRIADLHSHSPAARSLYLHPQLFRLVELIFDAKAVAFQSLYFQWGSEQGLHRDPMFVVTNPVSHLVASWVALEDIGPEAGPLVYVPRSHRMPWFEFEPDSVRLAVKTHENRKAWSRYRQRMIDEMGLEVKAFTCKRGDVFMWHSGLLHGGMPVENKLSTRNSFATHYSTAAHYKSRGAQMQVNVGGEWRKVSGRTDTLLTADGCSGLDNPLHHKVWSE